MAEQDEAKQLNGKPDWAAAPEWAEYLAQDHDGDWYWWDSKPVNDEESWAQYWMPARAVCVERMVQFSRAAWGRFNEEWKSTLERRPFKQESK